ncbi:MAG TPA: phosphoglycerate dehydrogenase [Kineosporiaceae bacterium]|nr:phosphoglycerate dehydrogenase [Kineosporiaceae bacterium]
MPVTTPPPARPRHALLLEGVHPDAEAVLAAAGFEVSTEKRAFDVAELADRLSGIELLGIRSGTHVPEKVLDAAPDLLAVGAFCIGTNQIDLSAAAERGVAVFNAPFSNTRSVVELALAEVIALTRRLTEKDTAMHGGVWDKSARGSHEVRGRKLGIVGYGNIGTQLSVVAEALGMSVVFYDTADRLALGNARRCASLDELLETADVVTLHVDGRPSNADLFGEEQFAKMRPGSLFLNLSRGFVVDHHALRRHIESGHIAGAAVDVFPDEPAARGEGFESPLRGLPNVILTPHIGGSTAEAQANIGREVASKLIRYSNNGSTMSAVNFPEVTLPEHAGRSRLLHIHKNVPGVLAQVNERFSAAGINIDAQYLRTNEEVGYVVTDVDSKASDAALESLCAIPGTIRCRILY